MKTVALLRGINVGGRRKVTMAALREVFEAAGCTDVSTYIQSGNVIFTPPTPANAEARERWETALAKRFGFAVPLALRDGGEMKRIVAQTPFPKPDLDTDRLYVGFLRDAPTRTTPVEFPTQPGEAAAWIRNEIYLHLPAGVAKTKLTNAWLDRALGTVCTLRNWRTVLALRDLATSR
jgi:uncharacterized protein (DUF1697 family)